MKAQHTPGPWELHESNAIVGGKIDDHRIWLRPVIARFETGVSEANARLIAAAPELLEALQVAVEEMEQDWYQIDGELGPTMEKFGDLEGAILAGKAPEIAKARAAIAKATGEAQ